MGKLSALVDIRTNCITVLVEKDILSEVWSETGVAQHDMHSYGYIRERNTPTLTVEYESQIFQNVVKADII